MKDSLKVQFFPHNSLIILFHSFLAFQADEQTLAAAEDDEETIAREEEEAKNDGEQVISAAAELAQLAADADCPIGDLIPPGYLEACLAESCKPEEQKMDVDVSVIRLVANR